MSIADKLQTIAENEQRVYDAGYEKGYDKGMEFGNDLGQQMGYQAGLKEGYNSAVKTGTITITEVAQTISISGLPNAPKELHILSFNADAPPNDEQYYIGCLNYLKDGFSYGGIARILGALWLRTSLNATSNGAANGSIAERVANNNNVFTFENGTFTIDVSYQAKYYFAENTSYKWTAIF